MSAAFDELGFGRGRPGAAGLDEATLEEHRRRIHQHQRNGMYPGMAECIVVDGKVVYLDLCGASHKETGVRMTEKTLFRGYSMMKPMTAVALMSLVEEGKLRLDDPVSRYLPKFRDLKVLTKTGLTRLRRPVTLRHLSVHTSGIGYGPANTDRGLRLVARSVGEKLYKDISLKQDSGEIDTLEKLCDALATKPLLHQPGAAYTYGLGFDVLGRVMEVVTGQSLKHIIRERVLIPLGMPDATWDVPRARAHQVCGYYRILKQEGSTKRFLQRLDGKAPEQSAYVQGSPAQYPAPAGVPTGGGFWGTCYTGLLFSLRDIAAFSQMLINGGTSITGARVLKPSTMKTLRQNWFKLKESSDKPFPPGWGSGDVGWNPLGHVQLEGPHAGAHYMGGMSYFWVDPKLKLASAVMTETYWQVQPVGWRNCTDTMETVIEHAVKAASEAAAKEAVSEASARGSPAPQSRTRTTAFITRDQPPAAKKRRAPAQSEGAARKRARPARVRG